MELRLDQMNPDQINIDTPELVEIEMPLAGIGSRFLALLIDYLILIAGTLLLSWLWDVFLPGLKSFSELSYQWAVAIRLLIIFAINWGYFTLFEAFWNGRTPGKRIAKIHVIQRSGRAIGLFESMARNLVRFIDQIPFFYAVGLITMFCTRQHQRLGDLAAGTLVVRERSLEEPDWGGAGSRTITAASFTASAPPPEPHMAITLPATEIAKLSGMDLEVLENFFSRRLDMNLPTRQALAWRIAQAIQAKSGLQQPHGSSVETFLEATARQLRDAARMRS
ncbi:MAG: RDD family protein [Terracidiphilus sp.]